MSAALTRLLIQGSGAAVLLAFELLLQTRRISRIWLRWIPRALRETISPYFDPPPNVHLHVPDPNEIELEEDAVLHEKIGASGLRILLSAVHGLHDFEHYLLRFFIAFVAVVIVTVALVAVVTGIARL